MPAPLSPVTLVGRHVRLEPLSLDHVDGLTEAATQDRDTYDLTWVPADRDAMHDYVEELLDDHRRARVLPFAQRSLETGRLVGCTRYLDPHWWRGRDEPDEIEIGGTWLASGAQRTGVNSDAKLQLLGHAFERLDVWRVAICTDARNARSRTAIERIGATLEGVLRNHRLGADTGGPAPRDTAVYSIIADEWPAVRTALERRVAASP